MILKSVKAVKFVILLILMIPTAGSLIGLVMNSVTFGVCLLFLPWQALAELRMVFVDLLILVSGGSLIALISVIPPKN